MFGSEVPENFNNEVDDYTLQQVPKFICLGSIFPKVKKKDTKQRIKNVKDVINNKKQLLYSNKLCLEIKNKLIKRCICSVSL
jgi:hypothetical protein